MKPPQRFHLGWQVRSQKNRPLPEPILILEFGKYRPLANREKSISIYLADFFFLRMVKYAESQVHRCKNENIYFKASLFSSLISSILKLIASKKYHFPWHKRANYYGEKGSKTFEGNSTQMWMYHLLRQTLSFRNFFNEDSGHTLPAREGIACFRLSDNGGKRKSKRYAKSQRGGKKEK